MLDYAIDLALSYWPHAAIFLTVISGILAILRKIAPRTETTFDDNLVKQADKSGLTALLERFNPFKRK